MQNFLKDLDFNLSSEIPNLQAKLFKSRGTVRKKFTPIIFLMPFEILKMLTIY